MFITVFEEAPTGLRPDSDEFSPSTHSYFNTSPNVILSYIPVTMKCSLPLRLSDQIPRRLHTCYMTWHYCFYFHRYVNVSWRL